MYAYVTILLHENKDKITQMLSLPSPLTQCSLEGLPIAQAYFCGQTTFIRGNCGGGGDYQCMNFHGQSYTLIKKSHSFNHEIL